GSSVYTLSKNGASSTSARFLADTENKADRIGGVDLSDKDDLLASVLLDMSMQATRDSSKRVAQDILGGLGGLVKLHKKNVEHAGFAVLKSPDIPSVLIETGFISNSKEAKRLASRSHQRNLSRAIVNGVVDYYAKYATEGTWVYWQKNKPIKSTVYAKQNNSTYKIQRGDTLSEVAMKNSVSLAELRRYNKLKNDKIRIGQVLKIPPRT
ncbi:MAG: N-acetylmuramoyl-L-alanine amidase, partial [Pseudomonadales bacterium]|nr:N-acetylmuramoyl-L-alanine amidase [Pseudomonadales bacterium]